jgi:GNAT superfamily N-acetyltransferase
LPRKVAYKPAAMFLYRPAELADIPTLRRIRDSVVENRLVNLRLSYEDYLEGLFVDGRTWLCKHDGQIVGFVCGRLVKKDIWALFLRPEYEGKGIGNALMAVIEEWMFGQGVDAITLTTAPGTRAERLYLRRGWQLDGHLEREVRYRLRRPAPAPRETRKAPT